jgi:hypothetical protein
VSQHVGVLRTIGFVHVDAWLDHFRRFWDQSLDALGTEIGRGKRARRPPG